MNAHDINEMWDMVVSERAARRNNQLFADAMVRQRDAAIVARDAARRDRAALLEARSLQATRFESGIAQQEEVAFLRQEVLKWQNRFLALQIEGEEQTTEQLLTKDDRIDALEDEVLKLQTALGLIIDSAERAYRASKGDT